MKRKIENIVFRLIAFAVFLTGNIMLFAQPPGGPPPGGGGSTGTFPPCWQPECIPIDAGVGFLIAAGIGLGAKKLYSRGK